MLLCLPAISCLSVYVDLNPDTCLLQLMRLCIVLIVLILCQAAVIDLVDGVFLEN